MEGELMAVLFWPDHKDLASISPLVKDSNAWNAFIYLLEHERDVINNKLNTPVDPEELIRINGVCRFIEQLKKTRETALRAEKMMREDNGSR